MLVEVRICQSVRIIKSSYDKGSEHQGFTVLKKYFAKKKK